MIEVAERKLLPRRRGRRSRGVPAMAHRGQLVFLDTEYQVVDTPGPRSSCPDGLGSFPTRRSPRCASPSCRSPEEVVARYRKAGWSSPRPTAFHRPPAGPHGLQVSVAPARTEKPWGRCGCWAYSPPRPTWRASWILVMRWKLAEVTAAEDLIEGSHDYKAVVSLIELSERRAVRAYRGPAACRDGPSPSGCA